MVMIWLALIRLTYGPLQSPARQGAKSRTVLEIAEEKAQIDDVLSRGWLTNDVRAKLTALMSSYDWLSSAHQVKLVKNMLASSKGTTRDQGLRLCGLLRMSSVNVQVRKILQKSSGDTRALAFYAACRTGRGSDSKYLARFASEHMSNPADFRGSSYIVPIANIGFYGTLLSESVLSILSSSKSVSIRYSAVLALGLTNDLHVLPALKKATEDDDQKVARAALRNYEDVKNHRITGLALHYP